MRCLIAALAVVGSSAALGAAGGVVSAPAGPPEILPVVRFALPVNDWTAYRAEVELRARSRSFVPLVGEADSFPPGARFAIVPLGRQLVGATLTPGADGGYVCRVDRDGDGDLADEEPLMLEPWNGLYAADFVDRHEIVRGERTFDAPFLLRLAYDDDPAADDPLQLLDVTLRRGTIPVEGRDVAFGLRGERGEYDLEWEVLFFDLDGDGRLETDDERSPERVRVSDGYVNLEGHSYGFEIDSLGRKLTLTRLAERRPDRLTLRPDAPVPDLAFADLDGTELRLSDHRGRLLLLDFWATWCKPCVEEAPRLVELYGTYHDRGLDVLGFHRGGSPAEVREFAERFGVPWPQKMSAANDAEIRLFGVAGYPRKVLIGRDGKLVRHDVSLAELETLLAELADPE